jgi:hypothetical protein
VITAVLGDLALPTGVDDPVLGEPDHVGYPGIDRIDADEPRRICARVHLCKTGRSDGLAIDAGRRIVLVHEEEVTIGVASKDSRKPLVKFVCFVRDWHPRLRPVATFRQQSVPISMRKR